MSEYPTKNYDRFEGVELAQLNGLASREGDNIVTLDGKDYMLSVVRQIGEESFALFVTGPRGGSLLCDILIVEKSSGSIRSFGQKKEQSIVLISALLSRFPPPKTMIETIPDESEKLVGSEKNFFGVGFAERLKIAIRRLLSRVEK